ncbi:ATP-dependent DNA helicase PIF1 [Artemisia annua]|uniref:ATP-dependent DNA helicase PIF1 n=1 Tax=Artemisia annua TaxID=35608 RepID=A0A2U1MUB8_ARTAN|nr:ATP-dependent DNA helicase PIF1 [Artemisia annua]
MHKTVSSPLVSTSVLTPPNVINTPEISKSVQPKRGPGRPRKNPVTTNPTSQNVALQSFQPSLPKQSNIIGSINNNHFVTSSHVEQPNVINTPGISKSIPFKRGRGRPRKNPVTTNHTSPDVLLQTSQASVPKSFNTNKSIPNHNGVTNSHVDQENVIPCVTQVPPSKDSPNLVSSNKRRYNLHNENNENPSTLKNKFNDAKSSAVYNKHVTTVGKRAPLSDITSSTTSMTNKSISTFDVTTPFVSQQTNVTITPENSNSVVTHRGRGRPRNTPSKTNSLDQTKAKTRQGPGRGRKKTGAAYSVTNLETPDSTNAIPTNEDTYSRVLSDENPRSRFQNKTPIPFDIGSINHVDEQTSTIPNPTSTLEDRAHIKGKSIATENDIISSDEDTEDEHGYIDRICGISKDSPNLVSSNKRRYNLHNENNENPSTLKNKFNDAKSSVVYNKHVTTVGKRAPLLDITSSTTSMINKSISTFDVTSPFVSQQTNVTITPENSNSVVTHRGRGRPRNTPLTTNSLDQTKAKTRQGPGRGRKKTGVAYSVTNLETPDSTNAIPTNEDTYSRVLSDENPRSRFQNKTAIPFDIGSINHVDEQTSTIPNPTSTLEDRAHIKGKSIATENDIISSDEDTEDEHGYIDRICGISKDSNNHVESIIKETYENWQQHLWEPSYFQDRAILAPTHEEVEKINTSMMSKLDGAEKVYYSSDTVSDIDVDFNYNEAMVQEFTGIPSPPFTSSSNNVFPRLTTSFDLFANDGEGVMEKGQKWILNPSWGKFWLSGFVRMDAYFNPVFKNKHHLLGKAFPNCSK